MRGADGELNRILDVDDTSSGRTLGTALFDLAADSFTLYEGNPCEEKKRTLTLG